MNTVHTIKLSPYTRNAPDTTSLQMTLFFFLHPVLLVAAGYCVVSCSLPVSLKVSLLAFACLASVWLVLKAMLRTSGSKAM